jgi:hypothetical protein
MATKAVTVNYVDPALNRTDLQIFNSPGGSNGQVQLNTGNRFGSTPNLVWSNTNQTLSILGNLRVIGNITGTYNTNIQNFKIQGGNAGYVMITTGNGNLAWVESSIVYSNANVGSYLPTYSGNLSANNSTTNNLTVNGLATFSSVANLRVPGGVNGQYLSTDGAGNLSWVTNTVNYGNANVANYLPTYTGNLTGDYAVFTHDVNANVVMANFVYGDGSNLTNLPVGNIAATNFNGNGSQVLAGNGAWVAQTGGDNTFSSITMANTPSGPANTIQYGLGNLVVWNDGGWTIGEYNGADYGTEGIRINPGIEGAADINLPADAANTSVSVNNYIGNVAINAGNSNQWKFDSIGNLTTPSNLVIGANSGGTSLYQYDSLLQVLGEGANSTMLMGWTANTNAPEDVAAIGFNTPYPNGASNVVVVTGNNSTTLHYWNFDNTGNLNAPGNILLNGGKIYGGTPTEVVTNSNITDIQLGDSGNNQPLIITFDTNPFYYPIRGTVVIANVTTPAEINGTWYFEAWYVNQIGLFTDDTYTSYVFGTDWSAWTSGGDVDITINDPATDVKINSGGYETTFTNDGNLVLPTSFDNKVSVIVSPFNSNILLYAGGNSSYTFGEDGNLTLPGNTFSINYANGVEASPNYANFAGDVVNSAQSNITSLGNLIKVQLDSTVTPYSANVGEMFWDTVERTVTLGMDNGVQQQVGLEQYIIVKASAPITNGQVVMFTGANGDNVLGAPADVTSIGFKTDYVIGVATQNINTNDFGYVTTFGKVHNLNTNSFNLGDILWLSTTTPGQLTNVEPTDPNFQIQVAAVTKKSGGDGHIQVRVTPYWALNKLSDVNITSPSTGQALVYNGSNVWINGIPNIANIAYNVDVANVTGLGNIATVNLDGSSSYVLYGNGVFAAPPAGGNYGDSNVVTLLTSYGSNTISTTGNVTIGNVVFGANAGQVAFHTGAYISGNNVGREGSIRLEPYTGAGSTFPGVIIGGAGRLLAPSGSVHQVFNASDVTFQVITKIISGTAATSTSTGALQLSGGGGIGITGNIFVGGLINVTGNANIGNISTAGIITATGNITGGNLATGGQVSATGNLIGSYLISTNASGDEGGEIQLAKAPNSTLSGNVIVDQYLDRVRIFESGGTTRGAYIDLSQAGAGVGTLLNNRVTSIVNSGVFVTMDLLKVQLTSSGNRGLSIASTTGSFTVNIGATYSTATSSIAGSAAVVVVTTTPSSSLFSWNFTGQADTSIYTITDITSNRAYRVTLQIGASFNNNLISIERLI